MEKVYPMEESRQAGDEFISEENIPAELKSRPQLVAWLYGKRRENGTWEKVPINPRTFERADATEPATWGTFEQALTAARSGGGLEGIGYAFSADDLLCGVDMDGCRNPDTGLVHPAALEIVEQLGDY